MRGSRALRGGLLMISKSGGLKPKAVAGKPSVTRLTQSSWTGMRASGNPRAAVRKMLHTKEARLYKSTKKVFSLCISEVCTVILTRQPRPRLRRWGIWWTVSCCYKWLCLPRLQLQWWRSCHQQAPSQRRSWPQQCRSPWQYQFQPSLEQEHRLLHRQSAEKISQGRKLNIDFIMHFSISLGMILYAWGQAVHGWSACLKIE